MSWTLVNVAKRAKQAQSRVPAGKEAGASAGLGLLNMPERARKFNFTFDFQSEPDRGSTVTAKVSARNTDGHMQTALPDARRTPPRSLLSRKAHPVILTFIGT